MAAEQPPPVGFAPDFRVGEWLVEPSLDRLSRNGTVLRLRPQLTNLLVVLAEHAGKTVSKDEILARVWEGQFVAESGMTRCIAELRQALGDDAREPKVLETIPKRGYRLVAPVALVESAAPLAITMSPAPLAITMPPAPAPVAPGEPAPPVPALSGIGLQTPEACRGGEPEGGGPAVATRQQWRLPMAVRTSLAATVLLGLAWGVLGWSREPVLGERDTVLLADVANATGDVAFDQTLRLALAVQLGQAPFLHMLPAERSRAALRLMGRPPDEPVVGPLALEVCRREGAAALIAGSIARLGAHYAVGLEALACRNGEAIARELLEVERKDDVLEALGAGAARLRRKLGESRASLSQYDVPIVRATTPSLDALEALSLGDFNRDHARLPDALSLYRRATDLDPQFAVAWARRGVTARNLGQTGPEARFGGASEPMYCFRRAYELRDRVSDPEKFYIQAHYNRFVEGDLNKAIETYRVWLRTYPGATTPTTNLAALYNTVGRYEEALPLAADAVRSDPYSSIAASALVVANLGSHRVAEAKKALDEAGNRGIDDLVWHDLGYLIAVAEGDEKTMAEQARWASRDAAATVVMTTRGALAAAAAGRLRESRRLWTEAAGAAAQAAGAHVQQSDVRLFEAETEVLLGDPRAALLAADAALALDRQPGSLLAAAIVVAMAGDRARARSLVDEAANRPDTGICARFVWRPVARAVVEAAPGRYEEALGLLREAAPFERSRDFGLAPLGIRASLELSAGRAQEAAATFQALLDLRPVAATSPWVAFARVGLARARREAGNLEASRAAYDAAIAWMKNADADAPLLVAARRERAALGDGTRNIAAQGSGR
jgi:DNA-binding winged helix-turn-helix (wHTH) protein/tetratricopeptide (TPR) repeat protein